MTKVIAIDGDGVLFDYNAVYPFVWRKAFGEDLIEVQPNSYHAHKQFAVAFSSDAQKAAFFDAFDDEAWANMPALPGAIEAVQMLFCHGYTLVCVSSMPEKFAKARFRNLRALGMPFERVIATGRGEGGGNPKKSAIEALGPSFFADDLLDNFRDLSTKTHTAWIDYKKPDSPSLSVVGQGWHDSAHGSLLDFAKWVISSEFSLARQKGA